MNVNDRLAETEATVVGVVAADFYIEMVQSKINVDFSVWDEKYPGWRESKVIYLRYDNPLKNMSFSEYWESRKDEADFSTIETEYENLPTHYALAVPKLAIKEGVVVNE